MTEANEDKKKNNRKGLIIAFIIILLAINSIQLWINYKNSSVSTAVIKEKDSTITSQKFRIDSVSVQLNNAITELEEKKTQLAKLGGDTAKLGEQIRLVMSQRNSFARESRDNYEKYLSIKNEIENAQRIAHEAQQEVEKLKKLVTQLDTINRRLKYKLNEKDDTIDNLKQTQNQMAEKIAEASVLQAQNIQVDALNTKGKEKTGGEYRVKTLDKLRITFTLGENKVAQRAAKDVYLRIIEPDGSALFDLSMGGGSFMADNKEIFYTEKQTVLYNGGGERVSYVYKKGSPYKIGTNRIEVYCEGQKIGEGSFTLK